MPFRIEIPHPRTTILVDDSDLTLEKISWAQARHLCMKKGEGWRLPMLTELEAMYNQLHAQNTGNFKRGAYWSESLCVYRVGATRLHQCNDYVHTVKFDASPGVISSARWERGMNFARAVRLLTPAEVRDVQIDRVLDR
jgi:hypothetical protein